MRFHSKLSTLVIFAALIGGGLFAISVLDAALFSNIVSFASGLVVTIGLFLVLPITVLFTLLRLGMWSFAKSGLCCVTGR